VKQLLLSRLLHRSALTVVLLASSVLVAHANHPWSNYHWARTGNPFTLSVGDNTTTSDWQTTLDSVISDWATGAGAGVSATGQAVTAFTPLVVTPVKTTGVAGSRCKAVNGTIQVCNNRYGANGWLGLATIGISGGHITQGTAKLNDTYLSASGGRYNTVNERRHVMCQEVAHTFGIGHQSTNGDSLYTCMDYFSNTGVNKDETKSTIPNYHDYEQLFNIYSSHPDTSSTVSSTAAARAQSNARDGDDPKEWGRMLNQSPNGRSSVYEQNVGMGIKIIRHVRWTEETAARCQSCDHRFHDVE
jgi:hypothetical protein